MRPDPRAAAAWFRRAADKGHADSQFALGQMVRDGVGMRADPTASYALFVRAARQGHAAARYAIFMTGPSATADIEGVLIHGAQGIRSLTVVPVAV